MHHVQQQAQQARQFLSENLEKSANILVVDDQQEVREMLAYELDSPHVQLHFASSVRQALKMIPDHQWNLWILDVNLGFGDSAFDILNRYPKFPFLLFLSGMQSMSVGFEAAQRGILSVVDKNGYESIAAIRQAAERFLPLSYVINQGAKQRIELFKIIANELVTTPQEWARIACIGLRRLQEVCTESTGMPPRSVLALYYALVGILSDSEAFDLNKKKYVEDCISLVYKNSEHAYKSFFTELTGKRT